MSYSLMLLLLMDVNPDRGGPERKVKHSLAASRRRFLCVNQSRRASTARPTLLFELLRARPSRRARGRSPRGRAPASTARPGSPRAGAETPWLPRCAMTDLSPFCPPAEPRARMRSVPSGRSMSSTTTQSSEGSTLVFLAKSANGLARGVHVRLRKREEHRRPARLFPGPRREEHSRDRIRIPSSAASASTTRNPALCRVVS